MANASGKRFSGFQDLLRPGPDAEIAGEIEPADGSCRVDEELAGTRNIVPVDPGAAMKKVITPNCLSIGIRKKCVRVASFLTQLGRFDRSVHANGHRANTEALQVCEMILNTP